MIFDKKAGSLQSLFLVFARARENARRSSCQSNLKQLGLSFHQYILDNDSRYPHVQDCELSASGTTITVTARNVDSNWPVKLEPYTKNRQIFNCPSLKVGVNALSRPGLSSISVAMGWKEGDNNFELRAVMYGYNGFYLGGGQWRTGTGQAAGHTAVGGTEISQNVTKPSAVVWYNNGAGVLESELASPASTVLLVDNNPSNNDVYRWGPFAAMIGKALDAGGEAWGTANDGEDDYDSIPNRHLGGANVLFTDGHVKWLRKDALLWTPASNAGGIDGGGGTGLNYASTDDRFLWNRF
jgi:prepilin-type processing-associated H-X9-DG protein